MLWLKSRLLEFLGVQQPGAMINREQLDALRLDSIYETIIAQNEFPHCWIAKLRDYSA